MNCANVEIQYIPTHNDKQTDKVWVQTWNFQPCELSNQSEQRKAREGVKLYINKWLWVLSKILSIWNAYMGFCLVEIYVAQVFRMAKKLSSSSSNKCVKYHRVLCEAIAFSNFGNLFESQCFANLDIDHKSPWLSYTVSMLYSNACHSHWV